MQRGKRTTVWIVVGAILLVAVGVGIGIAASNAGRAPRDDGNVGTQSTSTPNPVTTTTPTGPTTGQKPDTDSATPPPADGAASEEGRHFTYIKAVSTVDGSTVLTVDYAQMLTGDEAAAAATAAGYESPPPNDYFIVNQNTLLRTFPADTTINVTLTSKSGGVEPEGYDVGFGIWHDMFIGMIADAEFVKVVPYWITIEGGTVTAIEEQYLP